MAEFNKQILGRVKGALGDITFRQRNGKTFLSTRPGSFIPGSDNASIARREKFSLAVKLGKTINSIPILKSLWELSTPQGTAVFNHITRINYPMVTDNDLTSMVKLVPSLGFNTVNPVITVGLSDVKINIEAIGTSSGIDAATEPFLKLAGFIYMNNPSDESLSKDEFIALVSEQKAATITAALEFTFPLSDVALQQLSIYQNKKCYFALLSLNAAGNVIHFSNTFVS